MAVTTKGKALMDTHMSRQSMQRAVDAVTKDYKTFSFVVPGGLEASKRKGAIDIVSAIKKTIETIRGWYDDVPRTPVVIEKVEIVFVVRDSSTIFNYGEHSARYEQIKKDLREYLGDAVRLNPSLSHEKSYDFNVLVEGNFCEKEFWQ